MNMGLEKDIIECLEYLENTLETDYSINPVQAVPAVYIAPEDRLQNQIDNIKRKREMLYKVRGLINNIK